MCILLLIIIPTDTDGTCDPFRLHSSSYSCVSQQSLKYVEEIPGDGLLHKKSTTRLSLFVLGRTGPEPCQSSGPQRLLPCVLPTELLETLWQWQEVVSSCIHTSTILVCEHRPR